MKPTNKGAPERGPFRSPYGTCFRNALASMLDLDIDEVPEFSMGLSIPDRNKRRREQVREAREWLAARGKTVWWFPLRARTVAEALRVVNRTNPGLRWMLHGATAWKGLNHTVCCLGDAVEFSPGVDVDIIGPSWPDRTHFGVFVLGDRL